MDNTNWKLLRIKPETHNKLKKRAAQEGLSMGETIDRLLGAEKQDEADALLDKLDAQYEKQDEAVEMIDTSDWVAGVAPECCCDFYYNYFYNHKSEPCEHWKRVRWTDGNGRTKINWYNDLIDKFEFADDWWIAMKEYVD